MSTTITFDHTGDFEAYRAAEQWLRDRNFSFGSSQAGAPQAIWHGASSISKWRNLSKQEQSECHATLKSTRNGPAFIELSSSAPAAARAAFIMHEDKLAILRHMLGATRKDESPRWGIRNHYLANRQDIPALQVLQAAGMVISGARLIGLRYFHATEYGCRVAGMDDDGVASAMAVLAVQS